MIPGVAALVSAWRAQAAELRALALETPARVAEQHAAQLEAALAADAEATLTLAEAVLASGIPDRSLRAMLADGRIVNRGRKGKPRIRRADLPRRPAPGPAGAGPGAPGRYDPAADAQHLASRLRAS